LIRAGDFHLLKEAMARSSSQGMKIFDQAIYELFCAGQISYEDAISHADSENEVRLMIKLGKTQDASKVGDSLTGVELAEYEEYGEFDNNVGSR